MKSVLNFGLLIAGLVGFGATTATADTLQYTLTEEGVATPLATWTMSSTPTPACPSQGVSTCYVVGDYFGLDVSVYLNGSSTSTLDTLVFLNASVSDDLFSDTGTGSGGVPYLPQLTTADFSIDPSQQLYTGSEMNPTMVIPASGSFTFGSDTTGYTGDTFILSVVNTPEPSTILMLAAGLVGLVAFRRKLQLAN
jgi:hypothetical protein